MKFVIQTDGASRGNPGPSSAAFVIKSDDGVIWAQQGVYLGIGTNNNAEYLAVKLALERLIQDFTRFLPTEVEFVGDSLLIISQLSGKFNIKNENLKTIYTDIKELETKAGTVRYTYTPRANNFLADKLANQAIDDEN
jgi:ribonuclease HI